jgi:hypothetical protein
VELPTLEKSTNEMLTSVEFTAAMNEAAERMRKSFDKSRIPGIVYIEKSGQLDNSRQLGGCGTQASRAEFTVMISEAMCLNILKHKGETLHNNNPLILLACVTVVHEISHLILRSFHLKETPPRFREDLLVNDLGDFVERKLFGKLKLPGYGLKLFTKKKGWLSADEEYQNADLGKDEFRDCRHTQEYVDELVESGEWRAPRADDIEVDTDFEGKYPLNKNVTRKKKQRGWTHEIQPRRRLSQ